MKCSRCNTEFTGDVCPLCGLPVDAKKKARQHKRREKKKEEHWSKKIAEGENWTTGKPPRQEKYTTNSVPKRDATYSAPEMNETYTTPDMQQRSLYRQSKFIIGIIVGVVLLVVLVIACVVSTNNGEKISWDEIVLANQIPEVPSDRGYLYDNDDEELYVYVYKIDETEYADYLAACQDMGYTVDADETSYSYEAYNEEGYCLYLDYDSSDEEMLLSLEAPIEVASIIWPMSEIGQVIPTPNSLIGVINYEWDDSFSITVAETSEEDFEAYLQTVMAVGFTVDRYMYDDYYSADNSEGYSISITYEGNNLMTIRADAYDVEGYDD